MLAQARLLAQQDNRTLTNFIETILKQSLSGRERDDGPPRARGDAA
jgi:hypothetical protein